MIQSERAAPPATPRARPRAAIHRRPTTPLAVPWPGKRPNAGTPPLVPLLAVADDLTPELDRALTKVALAARAGDPAARDALYLALEAKIARFVRRYTAWDRARHGPWRDGRPWHAEDLAHDAYVVFADLVATWSGDGSFGHAFFTTFPWRLRDAANLETGPWRRQITGRGADLRLLLLADGSATAAEALALLETLAADLPPADGDLLRWHIRDGQSLVAIARRLDLSPRTVRRHWATLLAELRPSFGDPEPKRTSKPRAISRRNVAPKPPLQ